MNSMAKRPDKSLVVGLNIGTSKIVAIVGEIQPEARSTVIGLGSHPSRGTQARTTGTPWWRIS